MGQAPAPTLQVQHTRKSDSVPTPPPAVREEVVSLGGAGSHARVGVVVPAPDEASFGRSGVVRVEAGVNVVGGLCRL